MSSPEIESFLVISHISKRNNARNLIFTACCYGLIPIFVGMDVMYESGLKDDIKTCNGLRMKDLEDVHYFLSSKNIKLVAIEIVDGAKSVDEFTFSESIAFMPGNEGTGLNSTQRRYADSFIYIPQYGDGIESLNVSVATTIILHKYMLWGRSNSTLDVTVPRTLKSHA